MAIQGVDTKCYILALFVRDDGERFLLGSGHYEFKDTQMHFAANAIQNDIVEVQGNDGFLLAGQVRRPGTQSFDGYVGDGTMSKEETESYRRQFFSFFRKNFFYKVIYVFSDGTAIQRKSGFLVDDPTVEELYQMYPEYHVALNFEDVNYYSYSEDEEGQEQYAKEATIDTSSMRATGGLVWDNLGVVWEATQWGGEQTASGTEMTIQNDMSVMSIVDDIRLNGDTGQQTYSGYNLIDLVPMINTQPTRYQQCTFETVMDDVIGRNVLHITGTNNYPSVVYRLPQRLESGKYYALKFTYRSAFTGTASRQMWFAPNWSVNDWDVLSSLSVGRCKSGDGDTYQPVDESTAWKTTSRRFYVDPAQYTSVASSYTLICFSLGYNQNSSKELWLADAEVYEITEDEWNADTYTSKDYQPYTGGIPSPNPDYPQDIQVVTGEQTVTVTGKNLFNIPSPYSIVGGGTDIKNLFVTPEIGKTYTLSCGNVTKGGVKNPAIRIIGASNEWFDLEPNRSYTFTLNSEITYIYTYSNGRSYAESVGKTSIVDNLMIEEGSTATAYEPYQSQSYEINLGNNLFDVSTFVMGGMTNGHINVLDYRITNITNPLEVKPSTEYTISVQLGGDIQGFRIGIHELDENKAFLADSGWQQLVPNQYTFTTRADTKYIGIVCSCSVTSTTVTTGGTESLYGATTPTQWLRGCQVSLNEANTTTIELCKIGDYQDYIYKSGDDWYVHKETNKIVLDGSQTIPLTNWRASSTSVGWVYAYNAFSSATIAADSVGAIVSDKLLAASFTSLFNKAQDNGIALYTNTDYGLAVRTKDTSLTTSAAINAYLGSNPMTVYYPLATPTDTQITNTALVGQLEALGAMKLFIGENNLAVQATGTNLPAPLSFKYYTTVAMTGAEWEEGGSGGATVVEVDSITNTYPIWRVKGPAVDPQLSVINTNTTIRYTGTVTSTQTLEIDMFNKTAKLNGVSVIGNVSGDWVSLAPGTNRVIYTAENADAQPSTIEWQEVVG